MIRYQTYSDAVKGVKAYVQQQASIKAKVGLQAVTEDGRKVTIKGVHATRNNLLLDRKADDERTYPAYPVVEWVQDAIMEKLKLEKRKEELEEALQLVEITAEIPGDS